MRSSRFGPAAWMPPAAALILVVLGTVLWRGRATREAVPAERVVARNGPPVETPTPPTAASTVRTELDLRRFSVFRSGEDKATPEEVVTLPAGVVDPRSCSRWVWEPGAYEVQLLDSDLKSIASGRGTGEVRNFVTTVRVSLNPVRPRLMVEPRVQGVFCPGNGTFNLLCAHKVRHSHSPSILTRITRSQSTS